MIQEGEAQAGFVSNEYGRLNTVLVRPPGLEATKYSNHAMYPNAYFPGAAYNRLGEGVYAEHRRFTDVLRKNGVNVVNATEQLNLAIAVARDSGAFRPFLDTHFPRLAALDPVAQDTLTADDLYGGGAYTYLRHGVTPMTFSEYVRDALVMTPEGVVICKLSGKTRQNEPVIARFMLTHSPELQQYPIVYDASAEENGPSIEGGDVMVFDRRTMLMGVGGASERRGAERLAQELNMDVLAVRTTDLPERFQPIISNLGLHLDAQIAILDRDLAFAMPYFLDDEFGPEPFRVLMDRYIELAKEEGLTNEEIQNLLAVKERMPDDVGMVTIYEAGSGEAHSAGHRLVSYLREERGFDIGYIGGIPEEEPEKQMEHLVYNGVLDGPRFLIGNGITIEPRHFVGAREDARELHKEMRRKGVKVSGVSMVNLRQAGGAGHCATAPLERLSRERTAVERVRDRIVFYTRRFGEEINSPSKRAA